MPDPAELCAGAIVASGRRQFLLVGLTRGAERGAILLRRDVGDRLRSHLVLNDDATILGAPAHDRVACCDRIRWLPTSGLTVIGRALPCVATRAWILLRRVADAERDERSARVRCSIWEPPGGGRGRRIGGPSSG